MRKLFLFIAAALVSTGMLANYTPTADEVIILKDVYDANKTDAGYSKHSAIAWGGTASTNSKKAGDPNNGGAATSSNVNCYSVKGNGEGKNITISISGCSKIIVYHESHSSRYVELRSGSKTGTLIGNGSANTYYTEVNLNGSNDYSIFLHGTTGSDDQDFNVYAIKIFKAAGSDPVPVTGISLNPSSATIKVGKTVTLTPTITPNDATDKAVTWAVTSGSTYASVTSAGVVTGLAVGTAVVTATAHDGSGVTQTATITVEECPTSGTMFSMTITDPDGTIYTDVTDAAPQEIGATYVGGKAYATSTSSSKRSPKITGSEFDFNVSSGGSVAVKVELDCDLAEGDTISFTSTHDKNFYIRKVVGTDLHTTSSLSLIIPSGSALIGENVFYIMRTNSACSFSKIKVARPAKYAVTFNMHGHGDAVDAQTVVNGGKVIEPATTDITGWDFGGWYKEDTYDNEWDFANDVVSAATVLHAKWTAHTTSSDATLKSLKINNVDVAGFKADSIEYAYQIAYSAELPVVTAEKNESHATLKVTDVTEVPGTATVVVTAEDGTTKMTYSINFTRAAAKKDLLEVLFNNGAKGAITNGLIRVPYIAETDEPTFASATFWNADGEPAAVVEEGKLKVTGADGKDSLYNIETVAITPASITYDTQITFDSTETYIFNTYDWDSKKGWVIAKDVEQAGNKRISEGRSRMYFVLPKAASVQLTSGTGGNRPVKIYVNGVEDSHTNLAASGSSITIDLNSNTANLLAIESNGSNGDGGITKISVATPISTALDNTEAGVKAVKRLENGMLVIEKNGVRYNAMGQAIH